jgi:hypothetical protein
LGIFEEAPEDRFMFGLPYFHPHPRLEHGTTEQAWGKTTKVVRCEACGRHYAYALHRTGRGHDKGEVGLGWTNQVALAKAKANLQKQLDTGIDVIPCPACGWYQSSMIPAARRRHCLWMYYFGLCLTIGLIPAAVLGLMAMLVDPPPLPWPIAVAGLVCLLVAGTGILLWREYLAARHDPNKEDAETRKRDGRSRAILLSEQEAKEGLDQAGTLSQAVEKLMVACEDQWVERQARIALWLIIVGGVAIVLWLVWFRSGGVDQR